MRRIAPATAADVAAIDHALERLREARNLLREARAGVAARAAQRALKSAEGAARHVRHRAARTGAANIAREGGA